MASERATKLRDLFYNTSSQKSLYEICRDFLTWTDGCVEQEQPLWLRAFLEELTIFELAGEVSAKFMELDPKQKINFQEFRVLEALVVSNLSKRLVSVETFYQELWSKINDDTLLSDTQGKTAFLFFLRLDSRIPYFELEKGCTMSNEEYKELVDKIQLEISKGIYILEANLPYKTQRASLLLDIAHQLSCEKERIVFWAFLLGRLQTQQVLQRQPMLPEEHENPQRSAQ